MAFTRDEAESIKKAILWGQPPQLYIDIFQLIERETEKLVVIEKEHAWREVAADMVRTGGHEADVGAMKLLIENSPKAAFAFNDFLRVLDKVYQAAGALMPYRPGVIDNEFTRKMAQLLAAWGEAFTFISNAANSDD